MAHKLIQKYSFSVNLTAAPRFIIPFSPSMVSPSYPLSVKIPQQAAKSNYTGGLEISEKCNKWVIKVNEENDLG